LPSAERGSRLPTSQTLSARLVNTITEDKHVAFIYEQSDLKKII